MSEVLKTAKAILYAFDLQKHYGNHAFLPMWDKYEKAITLFYTHRKRPKTRRMLIPTLNGGDDEKTRDFLAFQLELK